MHHVLFTLYMLQILCMSYILCKLCTYFVYSLHVLCILYTLHVDATSLPGACTIVVPGDQAPSMSRIDAYYRILLVLSTPSMPLPLTLSPSPLTLISGRTQYIVHITCVVCMVCVVRMLLSVAKQCARKFFIMLYGVI